MQTIKNPLKRAVDLRPNNEAIDILISEGGESFYNYIEQLGLVNEPDLIVLSSEHHYYYDSEEMNRSKTIINLKELNQIINTKGFKVIDMTDISGLTFTHSLKSEASYN